MIDYELKNLNTREDEQVLSFESLEKALGYRFKDRALLRQALTHSSYVNEIGKKRAYCNERLEFLGDAVLELASSDRLYKSYPAVSEGKLSKTRAALVCESALAARAEAISLGDYLILGKGEEKTGGRKRPSLTSDAVEAVIGAIYLDGGFEEARSFVDRFVLGDMKMLNFDDCKTALQELVQKKGNAEISYRMLAQEGPDHDKTFTVEVSVGKMRATGRGKSKKAAEQMAAKAALEMMRKRAE